MNAEERRDVTRQEMADLSWDFLSFYGDYYNGKSDDEELLEMATQPFWQSMRLSKKRLDSKGLTMDVELSDDLSRSAVADGRVHMSKDGTDLIGTSARRVLAKRRFLKNNKEIYAKREHEISAISLLKADIEGDTVACPNCGHVGTVQSYIDGCDACGARFTVKDFATKISAFSLEENMEKKLKKTTLHTIIVLAILTGLLMLFGAICFGIVAVKLMTGQNNAGIISSVVGFAMALDLVPVGLRCIILLPVVYIFLLVVVISRYRKRYIGTDIIKAVLPDFSAEDFCQNLEYKLRNIHMTDKASDVAVFAYCSLKKVIEKYHDVVDGTMTRCYFKGIHVVDGGYIIDAEVIMRLTKYNGKRIRTKYEKLSLSLFGKQEVVQKKTAALREYKCSGCGSSINILEGSVCKSCDSVFDYADYGWVFKKYEILNKPANIYSFIRFLIVAFYVLVFATHIFWVDTVGEEDTWLSIHRVFTEQSKEVAAYYDAVIMPDEIDDRAALQNSMDDIISRKNVYSVPDGIALAERYLECLIEEGFLYDETAGGENVYILQRPIEVGDIPGYLQVTITGSEDTIEVLLEAMETEEE